MSTAIDVIEDLFEAEQQEVADALHAIMDAAKAKDFPLLASYHLHSPKFTKFDDFEPLDRQDAAAAQLSEEEGLGSVENFRYQLRDLKIDVFGRTAVATFVFVYGFRADGEEISLKARATMVFVNPDNSWLIAHEHFSPFKSNP